MCGPLLSYRYRACHIGVDAAVVGEGAGLGEGKAVAGAGGKVAACRTAAVACDGVGSRVLVSPGNGSALFYR